VTVKWTPPNLKADPAVPRELLDDGWLIANDAARMAPKDTTLGAKSIRAELVKGDDPEVRISWDRDHFYMSFQEFGTEDRPAQPFLRPAANRYR
jgi:HK97 gp10 family phage protein